MKRCYSPIIPDPIWALPGVKRDGMIDARSAMRRALSISLILLLWLPALAALIPGIEDERLPFCCRRQGAHHCAMGAAEATAPTVGSGADVSARSVCPQFPATPAATIAPACVPVSSAASGPALVAAVYSPGASREDRKSVV